MSNIVPPRPLSWSDKVKRSAIETIIGDVAKWAGQKPDDIRDDLVFCFEHDGYEFAKSLDDRRHWGSVNAELVEILDSAGSAVYTAHKAAERAWVKDNNVTVPFAVGDVVLLRKEQARIVDIRSDTAEIVAQPIASNGKDYGEKCGWLHPFEDARPVETGAAA